jgi:hypothetical protein
MRKTYSGFIEELAPNQIFVFGSNTQGRHGAGAAACAARYFGAIYGQAKGRQGQSYAIITKDLTQKIHPSISILDIAKQIEELYNYARQNPELEFLVAYSGDGVNLNGYSSAEMARMFSGDIPDNVIFEQKFSKMVVS